MDQSVEEFKLTTRLVKPWIVLPVVVVAALIALIVGGYAFNWSWTGFRDNKLWDWLRLLLVPFVLPLVAIWFTTHPIQVSSPVSQQREHTSVADSNEKEVTKDADL